MKSRKREFQAAIFGVVVVPDSEGNVERIARQEGCLPQALRHVPAEGIEGNLRSQFPVFEFRVSRTFSYGRGLFVRGGSRRRLDDSVVSPESRLR